MEFENLSKEQMSQIKNKTVMRFENLSKDDQMEFIKYHTRQVILQKMAPVTVPTKVDIAIKDWKISDIIEHDSQKIEVNVECYIQDDITCVEKYVMKVWFEFRDIVQYYK